MGSPQEMAVCFAKWMQMTIGIAILLGSFMHLNDKLSGEDWCDANKDLNCIGDSLTWAKSGDRVADNNFTWRQTFTFAPSYFIDTWTPFFFGILVLTQHFPSLQVKALIASWGRCLGLYLFGCFWALFGYAGNWGVFWGFICTLVLCPILLYLAVVDGETEQTQVDFTQYLAMVGLTNASEKDEDNNQAATGYDDQPKYDNEPNNSTYSAPPATGSVVAPPVPSRQPPSFAPDAPVQVETEPENNHYG